MLLGRMLGVFGGMDMVPVCYVCMMGSLLMISGFVMLSCFVVVACSVLVMFRCLLVMMTRFLRHVQFPFELGLLELWGLLLQCHTEGRPRVAILG
jgi:hypothetical protein